MKKILLTITISFVTLLTMAQSPNLMNYQGVARNAVGNVLPNQSISLRLSILNGSAAGPVVYSETRTLLTNAFGLFNVVVGSSGFTSQTGTIAGINWTAFGAGSGTKYLQVEIDPNGGSSFTNVGSTQMVSVPYALNAGAAAPVGPAGGDLTGTYPNPQILFPLIKTFSFPTTQLIGMTNSSATGTLGAITGSSSSQDPNANGISGTISSTSPGGFSTALRGTNNGTSGLGIGVTGSQAGSGWGVYGTTPSGLGVYGNSTSGYGVYGLSNSGVGVYGNSTTNASGYFENTNAANTANTLNAVTNGVGNAVSGINTGTGRGGFFQVNNATSTANALEVTTNGIGASWGIRANSTGTNGAGLFVQTNATNTANNVQSNQAGLGRAGFFNSTNTGATSDALFASLASTNVGLSAVKGVNALSTITAVVKLGGSFETDNGIGALGTSNSFSGVTGGTLTGTGVTGVALGSGTGLVATSINGPAANLNLAAGNASTVLTGTTAGTGITANLNNTNAANVNNTVLIDNSNTSAVGFGNGSFKARRGVTSGNTFLFINIPTAATGISSTGIGVQGTSETQYGVSGLSYTGYGVVAGSITTGTALVAQAFGTGYAMQTSGKLQLTGVNEAANRVLTSDATGNATWQPLSASGGVSGTGTLNFIPKWTPNGTTIGNSQLFDNGTGVGLGTTTPNARFDIANSSATARGAYITNSSVANPSSALLVQNNTFSSGGLEGSAVTAFLNPFNATTWNYNTPAAIKGFASPNTTVGLAGGIGVEGSSGSGVGIVGLTDNGTALFGQSLNNGYALQTIGKVQISGQGANTGYVLTSDASGNATWQDMITPNVGIGLQQLSSSVTIPASSFIPITQWSIITHETGGANYNNVTGEYTITVAGVYQVNASLAVTPGGNGAIDLVLNSSFQGTLSEATEYVQPTGFAYGFNVNVLRKFSAGEKISVTVGQNIGAASTIPNAFGANNFSVQLVRKN